MANSLGRPRNQPGGEFSHRVSGTRFKITSNIFGMRHRLERNGLVADYDIPYTIGSGAEGHSYLVRIGNYLFQSPVSYYSRRGAWDMSPGYQNDPSPEFNRPVTPECLFCHAGRTRPVAGSVNRYEDPPFDAEAITCDRCHGPGEAHAAKPNAQNIVNPRTLPQRARDSVCEQCHLAGEARIPNPGRSTSEFAPGKELEEVFSVYVFERPATSAHWKVVSHTEQLALSRCAQASGERMWCGSCHNPHEKPVSPAAYYRERCLACHAEKLPGSHPAPLGDCVGCHMPRREAADVHVSLTDHRILRRPRPPESTAPASQKLAAWREPNERVAQRNLGLAYISTGERDQSAFQLNEGFRLLLDMEPRFANDAAVLTGLGLVLLRKGVPVEAARRFERARATEPDRARHHVNLGIAYQRTGEQRKAIAHLERAIELDHSLEDAYLLLAEIYAKVPDPVLRRRTLERYLRFRPQSVTAREALR